MRTENIIKDLKNLEDMFDFSNLDKEHDLISNEKKKYLENLKEKHLRRFG